MAVLDGGEFREEGFGKERKSKLFTCGRSSGRLEERRLTLYVTGTLYGCGTRVVNGTERKELGAPAETSDTLLLLFFCFC